MDPSHHSARNLFAKQLLRFMLHEDGIFSLEKLLSMIELNEFVWFLSRPFSLPFILRDANIEGMFNYLASNAPVMLTQYSGCRSILQIFIFALNGCERAEAWHNGEEHTVLPFAYFSRVYEIYIEMVAEVEESQDEWAVVLHLLGVVIAQCYQRDKATSGARLRCSARWAKALMKYCKPAITELHPFLQLRWVRIVEALQMYANKDKPRGASGFESYDSLNQFAWELPYGETYKDQPANGMPSKSEASDVDEDSEKANIISSPDLSDNTDTQQIEVHLAEMLCNFEFNRWAGSYQDSEDGDQVMAQPEGFVCRAQQAMGSLHLKITVSLARKPESGESEEDEERSNAVDDAEGLETPRIRTTLSQSKRTCAQEATLSDTYYKSLLLP
ncbi:hypothetical protein NM688_g1409 [Phlebia brevispora]|uniref:Uncharacterized protein n=1 Tax=Phlebia brevispora TaxID=194682 RepID=A0ACC1TBD5_9APHY|nr:hypothetical protein NM688_g1409 [Phlebia brevispora]